MALAAGTRLGPYEIVGLIGAGGMGEVYRARDPRLGREIAVKVLPSELAADDDRRARFESEARAASALNHPNIVTIHDIGAFDSTIYVAMELIDGRTLRDLLASGPLPLAQVLDLGLQMADGLGKAHDAGIVHRDLKPENIIVSNDGRLKILDFGLAKFLRGPGALPGPVFTAVTTSERVLTEEGTILGTVAYMSPEQVQGKPVDARSDIFSMGIVLYEMATGRCPFTGDNAASIISSILRDTPAPIRETVSVAPLDLDRIVRRCLEKNHGERYATGSAVRDELRILRDNVTSARWKGGDSQAPHRRRRVALGVAAILVFVTFGGWWYARGARERWIRNEAIPELQDVVDRIQALQEGRESWDAFMLAREIEAVVPKDPTVERLRAKFVRQITIRSDPPGAGVFAQYYDDLQAEPVLIGKTPLENAQYPRGFTRIRVELPGKRPVEDVIWNYDLAGNTWSYPLQSESQVPDEMVFVPAGAFELFMPGLDHLKAQPTDAFLIDRHEVTEREYKRFVDAGGYGNPKYWRQPFVEQGRTLSWKEATGRFVDRTGRPGPATWEVSSYPDGHDNFPVSGVSWYEAAAYAEWAGKSLPTIFHWNRVAYTVASSRIVPLANFGGQESVAVGSTKSVNRFGASDLAGNVREWTWNASGHGEERFILGGGWNDPDYAFSDAYAQAAFDRSPTNGFRCIRYVKSDPNQASLQRDIERLFRDFPKETPASDAVFAHYRRQFAYDKTTLDARIEEEKATASGIRQKITFRAAYGGERMMAYLFLPSAARPPYQTVVLFPGSGSISARSSADLELGRVDFVAKSGRAVMFPIYKGTYERRGEFVSEYPQATTYYKDYVIMWGKDLARSIDYLETRNDIDAHRIAYYGLSWGGAMGAILPAVEPRIKINILYVAGLMFQRALPEVDQINYVTRVKQPTLILNGELDFFFPPETSQRPMFELLGTPPEHKRRLVFPGGHSVPRTEMIRESLGWLDRYLGPPAGASSPR